MITNVRIGNDIKLIWQILDGGVPVNLTNATDIKVSIAQGGTPSCNKIEITTFEVTDAVNGMIAVEVQKEVITKLGYLWAVLEYTVPDSGMIDGDRKVTVDNVPVRIVSLTAEASQVYEFNVSSDILAGFHGKSAYEVWLVENPDKTKEDYYAWLQKPATDIAETVGLQEQARVEAENTRKNNEEQRVEAELLRQSSIQEAISNAEEATLNANTAAQNADDARLAIQDDLALKADQADLVQLESDVEQLAYVKIKNEAVNGNFENGLISPFSKEDGQGGASTLSINSSTPISGNYDIRLTITTPSTNNARPIFRGLHRAGNIGDKIYLHFYAKILSDTPRISGIHDGTRRDAIHAGDVINGRNTRIIDVGGTQSYLGLIYLDSRSVWDMQMDNFMRINLTETFGAGNEPTEEEMNLLISTLGIDYFEGEITIPAQKIMQWQLKLIRKNKNAIIALGGTII